MNLKNLITRIFLTTLFITNTCISTSEEQYYQEERIRKEQQLAQERAVFLTGITIAGIAIGSAVTGYLIGSQDYATIQSDQSYLYQEPYSSNPEVSDIQKQFLRLSKYGRSFNFTQWTSEVEKALESNITKLDKNLYQIDASFIKNLHDDFNFFENAGYVLWWKPGYTELKKQKDLYLANAKQLKDYFKEHDDFIYSYRIINFYDQTPTSSAQLPSFIRSCYQGSEQYPLIAFKNNAQKNKDFLEKMERTAWALYPCMLKKAQITVRIIDHVITLLSMSNEYQQELDTQKHNINQDNLLAVQRQIAQAEKDRVDLMRRDIEAREKSNELKLREVKALEEKNRIEQERNRIDAALAGIYYRDDR